MNTAANESPVKLQPPGAGLPLWQMLAIKGWLGPVVSRRTPPAVSRERYERLTQKLIALTKKVPAEKRHTRILVPPMIALEDSSRFWSIDETLEHLLIVSHGIENVILTLAQRKVPDGIASTAKVKPKGAEGDWLTRFAAYAPGLYERIDQKMKEPGFDFNSKTKYRHPWFGPITARQWYWVMSGHQGVHYGQAKAIAQKL